MFKNVHGYFRAFHKLKKFPQLNRWCKLKYVITSKQEEYLALVLHSEYINQHL